jgi:hypothetical protein
MVYLDANWEHRLRPFDFRTSHHAISAFSTQEKYGAAGAFRRIASIPNMLIPTCEWLEAVAGRPKQSDSSGKYWLYDSRAGERHDRRCRFAFSLTSREWE